MKTNKRLVLVVGSFLVAAVTAYLILGAINTKNYSLELARSQNDAVLNEMQGSVFEPVASSKLEQCNRDKPYLTQNCEIVETRVYITEAIVNTESVLSTQLKINGWFSDFDSAPNKYFAANIPVNSPLFLQGNANRNFNDNETGSNIRQTMSILGTKAVPANSNGFFQGTLFEYSDQNSSLLAKNVISGKSLVFLTAYQRFTSVF